VNTSNNGSYPYPKTSIRMSGSSKASHLFSPKVKVETGAIYGLRSYLDTRGLSRGEVGYYIDEYDEAGNWISGKWLGAVTSKNVIDESYRYTPTSSSVKAASVQVYLTARASGYVYIDNVEFWKQ
ncbi:MAG: hypothetical protein ACK4NX_02900, partial [Candidatus Paceibacteria bacterium]